MVPYDDQVSDLVVRVAGPGGVGDEKILDAQRLHYPYSDGNEVHRVTLVVVEAALHGYDLLASEFSEDEVPLVPDGCRYGKSRDFTVRDDRPVSDSVGEPSEPASEHDPEFRDSATDN